MLRSNFPYGKIASSPTDTSWSLSYSAGRFFLSISLSVRDDSGEKYLQTQGKNLINDFEAEFFTLETFKLDKIKHTLNKIISEIPENITTSLVITAVNQNVGYLFLYGAGSILIKRDDKIGILLEESDEDNKELKSASGHLNNNDLLFLQTAQLRQTLSNDELLEALDTNDITEITEILAPLIHNDNADGQAAIFFIYSGQDQEELDGQTDEDPNIETTQFNSKNIEFHDDIETEEHYNTNSNATPPEPENLIEQEGTAQVIEKPTEISSPPRPRRKLFPLSYIRKLSKRQKGLLVISIILILVLIGSLLFTKMSTVNNKNVEIYNAAIEKAQSHIDEGEALIGLNSALATDELRKAKDILTTASDQISDGSKEQKQIDEKLDNVNSLIKQASGGKSISAEESKDPDPMIELKKSDRDILFVSKDEDNLYALTNNDIYSKNIKTGNKDDLIGNEDYWSSPRGMSVYSGNIYVLDKSDGLIKFVRANDGFAQQSYFKGDVDLSKATGLTIDSSVYILFSDGTIQKYTRGESASFNLTGLDKPFDNPTRIFTYPDASYLYVLDPKNSRIVKLDKEGKVQSQFLVPELANAVEFSVDESKNKAYFLSSGTIYEIDL